MACVDGEKAQQNTRQQNSNTLSSLQPVEMTMYYSADAELQLNLAGAAEKALSKTRSSSWGGEDKIEKNEKSDSEKDSDPPMLGRIFDLRVVLTVVMTVGFAAVMLYSWWQDRGNAREETVAEE
jgi:hypothetical protein